MVHRIVVLSIAALSLLIAIPHVYAEPGTVGDSASGLTIRVLHFPLPAPGEGPFPRGGKHGRFATDGRYVYELGGDYAGSPGMQSGRSELWRLDTQALSAGQTAPWQRLVSYCGADQTVMPGRPDEVPFAYDSRRKLLVMAAGGFMYGNAGPCKEHPEITGTHQWMEFDIATGKWRKLPNPSGDKLTGRGTYHMRYDPVRDNMLRFSNHELGVVNRERNVQKVYKAPAALLAQVGKMDIRKEYTAIDTKGRWIYVLEPTESMLIRVNLDNPSRWEWQALPIPKLKYINGRERAVIYGQQMLAWTGDHVLGFSTWQGGPNPGPGSLNGQFHPWVWSENGSFHWLSANDPQSGVTAFGNIGCWVPQLGFVSIGGFDEPQTPVHEDQYMYVMKLGNTAAHAQSLNRTQ